MDGGQADAAPEPVQGAVSHIELHNACERIGGVYGSEPDGQEWCKVPPVAVKAELPPPAALELRIPARVELEVRPKAVVQE